MLEQPPRRKSSVSSILDRFKDTKTNNSKGDRVVSPMPYMEPEKPQEKIPERDRLAPRYSGVRNVNYGILDSFKKQQAAPSRGHQIFGNEENDGTPNRINALDSPQPVGGNFLNKNKSPTITDIMIPQVLLGIEVNRLMEVIKDYQGNLENLSAEINDLNEDNYKLKEDLADRPQNEQLDDLKAEENRLHHDLEQLQRELDISHRENDRTKHESELVKNELVHSQDENNKLKGALTDKIGDCDKLKSDVDRLRREILELKEEIENARLEIRKTKYEEDKAKTDYDRMKLDRDSLNTQMLELHNRISTLQNQAMQVKPPPPPPPVYIQQDPTPMPITHANGKMTLAVTDFLHDDKNSLLQLLVRRNLENDQLRKEVELLRGRINIGDIPYNKQPDKEDRIAIAKDILGRLGDVMNKNKDRAVDCSTDFDIVRVKTQGLCIKIDNYGERSLEDSRVGNPGLADSIKNLHTSPNQMGKNSYEQDRNSLFDSLDALINKLTTQYLQVDQTTAFKPIASQNKGGDMRAELASALKKVVELETQNSLLSSKLDALTLGRADFLKPATPFSQLVNLSASHTVTTEELRGQLLSAKNEANEWKFRLEQSHLEREKVGRELEEARERIGELNRELDSLTFREKQALDRNSEQEIEKTRLNEKARGLEERIRSLKKEFEEADERREEQASDDRYTLQAIKEKMRELERKVEEKNSEMEDCRREIAERSGRIAEVEGRYRSVVEDNSALKDKTKKLEVAVQAKNEDIEDLSKRLAVKEREVDSLKEVERRLNEDLADVDNTCEFLKEKAEELKNNLELTEKQAKDLTEELNNSKNIIHQYEHQFKGMGEQLEMKHSELTQISLIRSQQQGYFVDKIQKLHSGLIQVREQLEDTRSELSSHKEMLTQKAIDVAKYLNSLKTLFWTRAELNPRGTLSAYRTLKDRHTHEIPKLQSQLQEALNSRNAVEHQSALINNKSVREFEDLEKKLNTEKDKIVKEDRNTQERLRAENDEFRKANRKLEELVKKAVEENKILTKESDRRDMQASQLTKELEHNIKKAEELRVKSIVLEEQVKTLSAAAAQNIQQQYQQSLPNQQVTMPPGFGYHPSFYKGGEPLPPTNGDRSGLPKPTRRYSNRINRGSQKRANNQDEQQTDPSVKFSVEEDVNENDESSPAIRDVASKKAHRGDRPSKEMEESTNRDPRGMKINKNQDNLEYIEDRQVEELQEALQGSYAEISALREELALAADKIHYYEYQLAGEAIASRQAEQLGRQIVMLEERLEGVTIAAEAKDRELELKDREISLREREIEERDREMEALRRQNVSSTARKAVQAGEENEKIEVLRQRTEAMLTKVEKKVGELLATQNLSARQAEPLLEETKQLRKKLGEANKKYVNEYIAVCQKGIDVYERTQSYEQ